MGNRRVISMLVALALLVFGRSAGAAENIGLTIVSPVGRVVVRSGGNVIMRVETMPGFTVQDIAILSTLSPEATECATGCLLVIPTDAVINVHHATAIATTTNGDTLVSMPIDIEVQPDGPVASLQFESPSITLGFVGDVDRLPLRARTSGEWQDIRRWSAVQWSIADPSLLSLSSTAEEGEYAIARKPGQTKISASVQTGNGKLVADILVVIENPKAGDLDGDDDVDDNDLAELRQAISLGLTTSLVPGDARDLTRDGQIDALDQRVLVTLCTRPRCAVR